MVEAASRRGIVHGGGVPFPVTEDVPCVFESTMKDDSLERSREWADRWLSQLAASALADGNRINLEEAELWWLLDSLPVAILVSRDRDCRSILGNAAARALYGLSPGENFSLSASAAERPTYEVYVEGRAVGPGDLPMQEAARTGRPVVRSECEIRFLDGRRMFLGGHTIPIRDAAGQVCGSIGAFLDLTVQNEEVEFARVLSREMAHRLKNTVAIIQSISRRTIRPLVDEDAYRAYEDRLISLASFQDLLSKGNWARAGLADIVETTFTAVAQSVRHRVSAHGPQVSLPSGATLAVSMILHELATNACKYGSLSTPDGRLDVTWQKVPSGDEDRISLQWREAEGPPVQSCGHSGFGTVMMDSVCRGLADGHLDLDFQNTGLCARLSFSLTPELGASP